MGGAREWTTQDISLKPPNNLVREMLLIQFNGWHYWENLGNYTKDESVALNSCLFGCFLIQWKITLELEFLKDKKNFSVAGQL
jgi:hypothetical protein